MERKTKIVCKLLNLERTLYEDAWELQRELVAAQRKGIGEDTLILLEHAPVYTIGRSGSQDNIKASAQLLAHEGLKVIEVDRGGDVTYHGPGQLVGYPILDLRGYGQDMHHYSWMLEEVIIRTLAEYGIKGFRESGLTGVWTTAGKIAAIGIGVRSWVSMHGFALNVKPNMWHFSLINPCGITDRPVVSMQGLGIDAELYKVRVQLSQQFATVFNVDIVSAVGELPGKVVGERPRRVTK